MYVCMYVSVLHINKINNTKFTIALTEICFVSDKITIFKNNNEKQI